MSRRQREKRPRRAATSSLPQDSAILGNPGRGAPEPISAAQIVRPRWLKQAGYCILLLALTSIIYGSIVGHTFVNYDDAAYIANPYVQEGLTWKTVSWACTHFYASNWHPLTWLVHTADYQLFGFRAGMHHLVSLLLHLINVVLLFLLLAAVTGSRERSLVVASLFAVHPLNVESVAWAAELKNVLCTLFFLLALAAYGWYARRPFVWRYTLLVGMSLLALASKPMAITLPFVLLLLDFWPLQRIAGWAPPSSILSVPQQPIWKLILEKLPLLAMSAVSGLLTLRAQRSGGATTVVSASLFYRLENALHSYAIYIWKLFWPSGLAPFYPFHLEPLPVLLLVLSAFSVLSVSILAWQLRRGKSYLVTGWLWYLGTLVPVIGFVQVGGQAWADRYAYIPLIGVLVMVVWGLADLAESLQISVQSRIAFASIVLVILSVLTLRQITFWKSSYDLWTHTLEVTKGNAIAERNLAMEFMRAHRWGDAAPHLLRANQFDPGDVVSLVDLGAALAAQGRDQEAVQQYENAVQRSSDPRVLLAAYRNLGYEYHKLGYDDKAVTNYREALHINPREMGAMEALGRIMVKKKVEEMAQSLAERPTSKGYLQYGRMLEQSNRTAEAKDAYQKALKLDPKLLEARQALDALAAQPGKR